MTYVHNKALVFDSVAWFKKGDIGDNSIFWKEALIIKWYPRIKFQDGNTPVPISKVHTEIKQEEILVDVQFEDGTISTGHFERGIKYLPI